MSVTVYTVGDTITLIHADPPAGATGATGPTGSTGGTSSTGSTAPPPIGVVPVIMQRTLNPSKMVMSDGYCHAAAVYERFQTLVVLKGTSATLDFHADNFTMSGTPRAFDGTSYDLLIDDAKVATTAVVAGQQKGVFTFSIAGMADGWHKVDVATPATETYPVWFVYVQKSGKATPQALMPTYTGSFDLQHGVPQHSWAMVPARFTPTPVPLPARNVVPFATTPAPAALHRTNVTPAKNNANIHRPNVNVDGVMSTFCEQAYFWGSLISADIQLPLLDGPRGVGTICMPTHMQVGHNGGAYIFDQGRRLVRVGLDGSVTTLFGERHSSIAAYWQDRALAEVVGDWSAIPVTRRRIREGWGFAWDPDSLALDPNAPPVNGLQPHLNSPRLLITDTVNNRVLLATYSKNTIGTPPIITEFLTGVNDPWDIVAESGAFYLSERTDNRITKRDIHTGALIAVMAQGAAGLATVDPNSRFVRLVAPLATVQAQPCVLPEGLFLQDGILSFGSKAMAQVKEINLATGVIMVAPFTPTVDGNSNFCKIARSDGTFGPRGTYFVWTWSNAKFGNPEAFLPGGARWIYCDAAQATTSGVGGHWQPQGYGSAGAIGLGRLYMGSSEEGLVMLTQGLATDPKPDYVKYAAGKTKWRQRGYHVVYDEEGYGYQGLPLPFGVDPDIDYFLGWNGL